MKTLNSSATTTGSHSDLSKTDEIGTNTGRRRLHLLALLLTLGVMYGVASAQESMPVDPGDKDKSDKGEITVAVKYRVGKSQRTASVDVPVDAGKSPKDVADAIKNALSTNQKTNGYFKWSDPEDKDKKGQYDVTATPKQDGVVILDISAATKKGSTATGLSYGGKIAELNTPIDGEFAVAGGVGQPRDNFYIELSGPSGTQTFALASYDGLTPSQIETDLAAQIDQATGYSTYIRDGVVYVTGATGSFSTEFVASTGTQDFSLSAGAFATPEPSSLLYVGSGTIGLSAYLRKRLLTRCSRTAFYG